MTTQELMDTANGRNGLTPEICALAEKILTAQMISEMDTWQYWLGKVVISKEEYDALKAELEAVKAYNQKLSDHIAAKGEANANADLGQGGISLNGETPVLFPDAPSAFVEGRDSE